MYTKDIVLNSKWYDLTKKIHTHPCFFGTATEVLKDCCGKCPPVSPEADDPDSPYVSGAITWVTVNPGAQKNARIGSFHPITEGDWTEGAYVSDSTTKMFLAVNSNDVKALRECIQDMKAGQINKEENIIDARDGVGRTALMIAAFTNSVDCAKVLLEHSARVSARTSDGRTPMMIAAAYGHEEMVNLLLKRGKELEKEKEKKKAEAEKKKKAGKKEGKGKKDKKKAKPKKSKKKGSDEEDEDAMEEDEEPEEEDEMEEEEEPE